MYRCPAAADHSARFLKERIADADHRRRIADVGERRELDRHGLPFHLGQDAPFVGTDGDIPRRRRNENLARLAADQQAAARNQSIAVVEGELSVAQFSSETIGTVSSTTNQVV